MLHHGVSASEAGGGDICLGTELVDREPLEVKLFPGAIDVSTKLFPGKMP